MRVERHPPAALAVAAADFVSERIARATGGGRRAALALSGGRTPQAMLSELSRRDLPWERVDVYQVDERVVAPDDERRNLATLRRELADRVPVALHAMPVDDDDLDAAARRYEASLPDALTLVHLGIGDDGHTASLFPGDPLLDERERLVAVTAARPDGTRRMTLTLPGLARGRDVLWLVTGAAKRAALARLLAGERSIPAGRLPVAEQTVLTDLASVA